MQLISKMLISWGFTLVTTYFLIRIAVRDELKSK